MQPVSAPVPSGCLELSEDFDIISRVLLLKEGSKCLLHLRSVCGCSVNPAPGVGKMPVL